MLLRKERVVAFDERTGNLRRLENQVMLFQSIRHYLSARNRTQMLLSRPPTEADNNNSNEDLVS